ncbi:hypothetical protein IEQ34_019778 [Dendrobium chrysotoxum]|uniref:DNA-directed RNA polymerase subunit n=1 Tax=Dendrobium chrysotoxum TaxID=161865 RepID=A0AAV7G9T1_DENCH|nr:hypothetical protein IEQ34_019778 [Dendrobium chrysotoxum]
MGIMGWCQWLWENDCPTLQWLWPDVLINPDLSILALLSQCFSFKVGSSFPTFRMEIVLSFKTFHILLKMVFLEIKMQEDVVVPFRMLTFTSLPPRGVILLNLLKKIYGRKASEDNGYYIAVTSLNTISELQINEVTGDAFLPVYFNCTTVKPCIGEILIGTVITIMESGIFLKSGPMKDIYLSKIMMEGYENSLSEEPMFIKVKGLSYMKIGTKVRFRIFDIKWIKSLKVFHIMVTILGDYLGPL